MRAIVCSLQDLASQNLFDSFLELGFVQSRQTWEGKPVFQLDDLLLVRTEQLHVFADSVSNLDVDEVVFATQHSSATNRRTLTAHPVGNFGAADHGGKPSTLVPVNCQALRNVFLEIKKTKPGFSPSLEATHHGPFLDKPCIFAEIGSTESAWRDKEAGRFLAESILDGLQSEEQAEPVIGIGKGHYVSKFGDLAKRFAFGHMCPDYALAHLTKELLVQMIEKTIPRPQKIVVDKRVQTPAFLEKYGLPLEFV